MQIKGWLSLFCGVTAVVSMIFAGIGFGNVSDMEQAESDNMLRMTFNVNDTFQSGENHKRTGVRIEMDTGVLSQSHVRYRVYETRYSKADGTGGSPDTLCYSGSVNGWRRGRMVLTWELRQLGGCGNQPKHREQHSAESFLACDQKGKHLAASRNEIYTTATYAQ